MERKIKVLLAKLGLDVHNRGLITVATELRDAGMEIIYLGNSLPREIIRTALQEDVDVVGVSSLGGAHLTLGSELFKEAEHEQLRSRTVFLIGGVFPPSDAVKLKKLGFDDTFKPGSTREEIVASIRKRLSEKSAKAA
jgi:methylmalonyl-CoA mutase C-terminal domain/subunit